MYKLNLEITITKEQLMDFSNDFMECGAFTSWACLGNDTEHFKEFRKLHSDMYLGEVVMLYLLEGNSITVYDTEDEDDFWELTLDKLLNGIKLHLQYKNICKFEYENFDYWDNDNILQFALFGELVFG